MIKKTIPYIDYDGKSRTEDFYFNLSQAECVEMEMSVNGGLSAKIQRLIESDDMANAIKIIKEVLLQAYGEKSLDGKHFEKSEELSRKFSQTRAYSKLYMELVTNSKAGAEFLNAIVDTVDTVDTAKVPAAN